MAFADDRTLEGQFLVWAGEERVFRPPHIPKRGGTCLGESRSPTLF
jgi:hypothetical protein